MRLAGAVALVTGASSGIGSAVAGRLAGSGARVLAHGRDPDRTTELARRIDARPLLAELRDPAEVRTLAEAAVGVHGRVDVLVACAGFGWSGPFVDMDPDRIEELVAVDLLGPIRLARQLLPEMVARGSGHVGLVTSVAGRTGVAGEAVYAAAKAGLDTFAESLRLELTDTGVGVSVVVPGAVRTPFFATRGRAYDRSFPKPVSADTVACSVVDAIARNRAERWVPRWVRVASLVRAGAPGVYRRLSARFGEPVRSGPANRP